MRRSVFHLAALLLIPSLLRAGEAKPWRFELERSLADEWQTSVRLGGRLLATPGEAFALAGGLLVTPEPGDWVADGAGPGAAVLDGPVTSADPIFASGLWTSFELNLPLWITLAVEPRLFMEWSNWRRSPGYVPEELAVWTTGSGWALVAGGMVRLGLELPFGLMLGAEAGIEKDERHVNLADGRDTVLRGGFLAGVRF